MVVRFGHSACIGLGFLGKQKQQTNHKYIPMSVIYFKELVHAIVGAGKSEVCGSGQQAQNSGKS